MNPGGCDSVLQALSSEKGLALISVHAHGSPHVGLALPWRHSAPTPVCALNQFKDMAPPFVLSNWVPMPIQAHHCLGAVGTTETHPLEGPRGKRRDSHMIQDSYCKRALAQRKVVEPPPSPIVPRSQQWIPRFLRRRLHDFAPVQNNGRVICRAIQVQPRTELNTYPQKIPFPSSCHKPHPRVEA